VSLFVCDECGCVENTALSRFWFRNNPESGLNGRALCSACDPDLGRWHGAFPKTQWDGSVPPEGRYIHYPGKGE